MDLLTAVAASMLPASRLKTASLYKQWRDERRDITLGGLFARLKPQAAPADVRMAVSEAVTRAESAIADGQRSGIEPVAWFDGRYPALLACIPDPPPVVWARGRLDVLTGPAVAVVGSRAASPYALQVAARLAAELAERGIVVVSGLARGVDSTAHLGCLDAKGLTVAITGSGLDRIYPAEHRSLAARIADNGLLLSELAPGAAPLPEHFPLRNRIISGISLAVVVVEANEKSGSLITAACALQQGRDVMAVPGSVLSGRNRGSHSLLKDGARIVESADDILEEIGWAAVTQAASTRPGRRPLKADPLLSMMEIGEVYGLDELVATTGTPAARLLPRLMELELLGYIEAPAGGRFMRRPGDGFW